jgi:hypothetical protein
MTGSIIYMVLYFSLLVFVAWCNYDWSKALDKCNKDWSEISMKQNEEWAELCAKIESECDALKKRVKELEAED